MSNAEENPGRGKIFSHDTMTVMGILNLTPDSFSDGGSLLSSRDRPDISKVVDTASSFVRNGVGILDIGGESTRPGADVVSVDQELSRVVPTIEAVCKRLDVTISIDTRKAEVASAALCAGARVVNDVSGFRHDSELPRVCSKASAVILGHSRDEPRTMQHTIGFEDLLLEVSRELCDSYKVARSAGILPNSICLDPGIGFGKTFAQNLELIANADRLRSMLPSEVSILFGVSRKAFLGKFVSGAPSGRDFVSHIAGAIALFLGATTVRVHAVAEAVQMAALVRALRSARRLP